MSIKAYYVIISAFPPYNRCHLLGPLQSSHGCPRTQAEAVPDPPPPLSLYQAASADRRDRSKGFHSSSKVSHKKKFRIRETPNLSTDADSSTANFVWGVVGVVVVAIVVAAVTAVTVVTASKVFFLAIFFLIFFSYIFFTSP